MAAPDSTCDWREGRMLGSGEDRDPVEDEMLGAKEKRGEGVSTLISSCLRKSHRCDRIDPKARAFRKRRQPR